MISANIFDIKRFGIHDGSGIRTVLFVKGCPLRCKWCQNPEGIAPEVRMWWMSQNCVRCGSCVGVCALRALVLEEDAVLIDQERCTMCGKCADACPTGAVQPDAFKMTVDEAIAEIDKDRLFYGEKGGVTLSGGECMASPEFCLTVLAVCRKKGIHTCVETCMDMNGLVARGLAGAADSIIADIKIFDSKRHKEATGKGNARIMNNFEYLAGHAHDVTVRIPMIPGYTADESNIANIANYVGKVNKNIPIELLNFNAMCGMKYRALGMPFGFGSEKPFSKEEMRRFGEIVSARGVRLIDSNI